MQKKKKTTLRDIARETGLTVSSVSRALRNDRQIGEEKKRSVQTVAQRLDYRNHLKRPSPSFLTISVYIGDVDLNADSSIYREMMSAIAKEAALHNCRVIPINLEELREQIKNPKNRFESLILLGFDREEYYQPLADTSRPIVLANSQDISGLLDSVLPDTYGCGVSIARHLQDQRHTSTLHIVHNQRAPLIRRLQGYFEGRKEWGEIDVNDSVIDPGSFEEYEIDEIKEEIIRQMNDVNLDDFDSVVCWGLVMKQGLLETFPDIVEKLPVVLVGHSEQVENYDHDGFVVCLPAETIGRKCVQQLVMRQFYPEASCSRSLISVHIEDLRKSCVKES